jgi:hypothetical protein
MAFLILVPLAACLMILALLFACIVFGRSPSSASKPPNDDIWGAKGELPRRYPNKDVWG